MRAAVLFLWFESVGCMQGDLAEMKLVTNFNLSIKWEFTGD